MKNSTQLVALMLSILAAATVNIQAVTPAAQPQPKGKETQQQSDILGHTAQSAAYAGAAAITFPAGFVGVFPGAYYTKYLYDCVKRHKAHEMNINKSAIISKTADGLTEVKLALAKNDGHVKIFEKNGKVSVKASLSSKRFVQVGLAVSSLVTVGSPLVFSYLSYCLGKKSIAEGKKAGAQLGEKIKKAL